MFRPLSIILVLSIFLISACKKKSDPTALDYGINWEVKSPVQGSSYLKGDTVFIEAKVTSKGLISNVEVRVHNDDDQVVSDRITYFPDSKEHSFTGFIVLNGKQIKTGGHYINFYAAGAEGNRNQYVNIQIQEGSYDLDNIYYSTVKGGQNVIYSLDDSSNWEALQSFSEPIINLDVITNSQLLFGLANVDEVICLNTETGIPNWYKNRTNLGDFPMIESMKVFSDKMFIPDQSGKIYGFNENGQALFNASSLDFYRTVHLSDEQNGDVVTAQKNQFSDEYRIVSYKYPSGAKYREFVIGSKVNGLLNVGPDRIGIFTESSDDHQLILYHIEDNFIDFVKFNLEGDYLNHRALNRSEAIILTSEALYRVDLSNWTNTKIESVNPVNALLAYDKSSNLLFINDNNGDLRAYDPYGSGQVIIDLGIEDQVSGMTFTYK